jgi:large-conductance mechanosensitive channel
MLKEFKAFVNQGNALDLAVAYSSAQRSARSSTRW